jgi:hypothetical protein
MDYIGSLSEDQVLRYFDFSLFIIPQGAFMKRDVKAIQRLFKGNTLAGRMDSGQVV